MQIWNRFYNTWLYSLEVAVIYALTATVTLLGLFMLIYRNFIAAGWDVAWLTEATYGLTYYLCLTGAIVASRQADHISIDILSHFVPARLQGKLIGAGLLIASVCALYLSRVAWDYLNQIVLQGPGAEHVGMWRKPLVPFFVLIGFHLGVQGTIRFFGMEGADANSREVAE